MCIMNKAKKYTKETLPFEKSTGTECFKSVPNYLQSYTI